MKRASSRELKLHLAEYISRAEKGETVLVTRRGEPVAKIVPVGRSRSEKKESDLEALAREWEAKGLKVIRPKHSGREREKRLEKALDRIFESGTFLPPGSAQAILDEDREERF